MMKKKRLLLLGASRYYVRSILAAKALGCEVLSTDRDPNAVGFQAADYHEAVDITDIPASLAVAKAYAIDGVVAVNDFGVKTAAAIAHEMGLVGISPQVAEYATSKAWMRRKWEEAGVPSARYKIVSTQQEAASAVEQLDSWPLILKPADSRGGGSRGVSVIQRRAELPAALEFAQQFYADKTVMIEEFLEGVEHSVETITYAGETQVIAVSDKVKTPLPYRVDKSVIYPTIFTGAALEQIHAVVKASVQALGIRVGAAHVELCTTKDGPRLFEIGARCGGGGTPDPIVPFLTGINMFKEVVRIALGEAPVQLKPLYTKGCVYRFITPRPGRVKQISGIEQVEQMKNILDFGLLTAAGQEIRPVKTGGDRAGFIIAGGETRPEALALADAAENTLRFDYE